MPDPPSQRDAAALRELLKRIHEISGLTYDNLAARTHLSRSSIGNYLTKPAGRSTETMRLLLDVLGASASDRGRALELHRRTLPSGVDLAEIGWLERARAAGCTAWPMAKFIASEAAVHAAIGRRHSTGEHTHDLKPPEYVLRAYDVALHRDIAAAAAGELNALIVLRGTSSTGKTRSLFEAVQELCPDWTVIRPRTVDAMRHLSPDFSTGGAWSGSTSYRASSGRTALACPSTYCVTSSRRRCAAR
jgi:transcriptional regulator with XRE-family HTH domain